MPRGYLLTIDGIPYVAASNADAITPTSWTPSDDAPTGASILTGALVPGGWQWTERMQVTDGDLDVGGITFQLEDVVAGTGTGIAAGQHWLTYLATRDPRSLGSSVLSSSITAAATSFTLVTPVNSALTGAMPGVLWLDGEAINCTSINAGTGVVTVAASGRGYLGTRAVAHTRDDELGTRPTCWAAPPWTTRRRVILWYVNDSGAATALWRGYCQRAPRLASDGARFELQCESAWSVERARPLGNASASCRVRGYNRAAIQLGLELPDSTIPGFNARWSFWNDSDTYTTIYNTFEELLTEARQSLHVRLLSATPAASSAYVQTEYDGSTLRLTIVANGYTQPIQAGILVLGEASLGTPVNSSDPKRTSVEARIPSVGIVLDTAYGAESSSTVQRVPVDTVAQLPSTFADLTTYTVGAHTVTLQPALVGQYDDDRRFVVYGSTGAGVRLGREINDSTIGGPSVTGLARFVRADIERFDSPLPLSTGLTYDLGPVRTRGRIMLDRPLQLRLCTVVNATHWLYGLRYALTDTAAGLALDGRQFTWDDADATVLLTDDDLAAREWYLDGGKTLGDLITPTLSATGCCPAVRAYGRIGFVAHRYPLRHETPTVSFTSSASASDLVAGTRVEWTALPEGLVNEVTVKTAELPQPLMVRDSASVQRYERGTKTLELELEGLPPSDPAARDPRGIANRILSRIIQLWGDPVALVRWTTTLERATSAYLGDFVALTDATAPNGSGGRGLTSAPVYLTGKTWNLGAGTITWEGLLLPYSYGYAPAVKVSSISGTTVNVAGSYVGGSTDYSGAGGTDRGISDFVAGDRCKLLRRNVTTYDYLDVVISSVNAGASTITLTGAPGATWEGYASGGWVDLVANDWGVSGLQAAQQRYAYGGGGNAAEGAIASTSESSRRWAP